MLVVEKMEIVVIFNNIYFNFQTKKKLNVRIFYGNKMGFF